MAKAYLNAVRADAALEAARANVALAERILQLARTQKEAGTGTGIEVTRAAAVLEQERQRLIAAEEERTGARLGLLRAMGAGLDAELELTDAQARVARAREAVVSATFRQKAAQIALGAAVGNLDLMLD